MAQALNVKAGGCAEVVYTPSTSASKQSGQVCRPATKRSSGAIVLVHGGGGYAGSYGEMDGWRYLYRANGYTTFSVNYRLTASTDSQVYPEPEQDVKAAVQYLRSHASELGIDRIVLHGGSAGARLGAVVLTTPNDSWFSGANLWPGISDAIDGFIGFYGYYDGYQFDPDPYYGGGSYEKAVSVDHASTASGPSLLIHGTADALIGVSQSDNFATALQSAGMTVEYHRVAGVGHAFDVYGSQALTSAGNTEAVRVINWLKARYVG